MKKIRTIRRFHRQASDAHLVPPPRTKAYTSVTTFNRYDERDVSAICRSIGLKMRPEMFGVCAQLLMREIEKSGKADKIWVTTNADGDGYVTVIRKPRISKKLLANLTQGQKQAIGEK